MQAGLSLLANFWVLHQSSGVPLELGAGTNYLAGDEMGQVGPLNVPWSLGSEGWCSSVGRPVTHPFFQLV